MHMAPFPSPADLEDLDRTITALNARKRTLIEWVRLSDVSQYAQRQADCAVPPTTCP
jgi:hypothetical protein